MKKIEVDKELLQKVVKTGTAFVLAGTLLMGNTPVLLENSGNSTVVRAVEEELVNLNVQMGVNLYMNDKGFIPKDVNGNETYPFICDGTTYVPIRAIAELFNANVKWDANNNTVSITTTGEGAKLEHTPRYKQELYNMNITANKGARLVVNGVECIPTDVNNNIKDIYVVNGTTYVPVRAISTALGLPITWSDITNSVFIGKHKTEGLTVENLSECTPQKFIDLAEHCYKGMNTSLTELIPNDCAYGTVGHYLMFAMFILNKEYYNDEYIKNVFDYFNESYFGETNRCNNVDSGMIIFEDFQYLNFQFSCRISNSETNWGQKENPFDWNSIIINPEYAEFLNAYQKIAYECYVNKNYNALKKFIEDYLYGRSTGLKLGCNPMIDYWVAIAPCYNGFQLYPYNSQTYADFWNASIAADKKTREEHNRLYEYIYGKTLVKD